MFVCVVCRVGLSVGKGLGAATALINSPANLNAAENGPVYEEDDLDIENEDEGHHHDNVAGDNNRDDGIDEVRNEANGEDNLRNSPSVSQQTSQGQSSAGSQGRRSTRNSQSTDTEPGCSGAKPEQEVAMPTQSSRRTDGRQGVSKRGKALVTKKGLINKVKSTKTESATSAGSADGCFSSEIQEKGKLIGCKCVAFL